MSQTTSPPTFLPPSFTRLSPRTVTLSIATVILSIILPLLPTPPKWFIILSAVVWLPLLVGLGFPVLVWLWEIRWGAGAKAKVGSRRRGYMERRRARIHPSRVRNRLPQQPPPMEEDPRLLGPLQERRFSRSLTTTLLQVLSLINSTFILPWYQRITPSTTFPFSTSILLVRVLINLQERVSATEDLPQVVVSRVVPKLTRHFKDYKSVEAFLNPGSKSRMGATSGILDPAAILQSHFPSPLHPALPPSSLTNPTPTIHAHLRMVSQRLLSALVPEEEKQNEVLLTVVREILVGRVLSMVVDMLADPDYLNRMVEAQADKYQKQRNEINQVRAALDTASAAAAATNKDTLSHRTPRPSQRLNSSSQPQSRRPSVSPTRSLSSHAAPSRSDTLRSLPPPAIWIETSTKGFEQFLKGIGKIKNVNEAKRMRTDIDRDMRKYRSELNELERGVGLGPGHADTLEKRERRRTLAAHLARLETARSKADRKVRSLSGQSLEDSVEITPGASDSAEVSLRQILEDTNSQIFFVEFMQRRGHSRAVQFWLTVESFKDPLEVIASSDDEDDTGSSLGQSSQVWDESALKTAEEDLTLIWSTYLDPATTSDALGVEPRYLAGIGQAIGLSELAGLAEKKRALLTARTCAFRAQRQIYERMEDEDYADFRKTELYLQAAAVVTAELKRHASPMSASGASRAVTSLSESASAPSGFLGSHNRGMSGIQIPIPKWVPFAAKTTFASPTQLPSNVSNPAPAIVASPHFLTPREREEQEIKVAQEIRDTRRTGKRLGSWSTSKSPSRKISGTGSATKANMDFLLGASEDGESTGEGKPRAALFGDEGDDEPWVGEDSKKAGEDDEEFVEIQRMEAIQAALTSIIEKDDTRPAPDWFAEQPRRPSEKFNDSGSRASGLSNNEREESEDGWPEAMTASAISDPGGGRSGFARFSRPSATAPSASLDLATAVGHSHPARVTEEEGLETPESEPKELLSEEPGDLSEMPRAAPGELMQGVEISQLADKITKLQSDSVLLEKMIRTAELTGKQHELKLLNSSQSDLQRELRALEFNKITLQRQEFDNRLIPGQTVITVPRATVLTDEGGNQVVRYSIEVKQLSPDGKFLQGWTLARRYNEFYDLNQELRNTLGLGELLREKSIDLPGKQIVPSLTDDFIRMRRLRLERYLKAIISLGPVCDSAAVRSFLNRQAVLLTDNDEGKETIKPHRPAHRSSGSIANFPPTKAIKNLVRTFAPSSDDKFAGKSMLETLTESLDRQATNAWDTGLSSLGNFSLDLAGSVFGGSNFPQGGPTRIVSPISPENPAGQAFAALEQQDVSSTFTGPICDLLIEILGIRTDKWFRRSTIVVMVVLQNFLGGTVERKVRDTIQGALTESAVEGYVKSFQSSMWPDGQRRPPSAERTAEEKLKTRMNAQKKVQTLLPDMAAAMLGRPNAARATQLVFSALQVKILNQHIILTILDEILLAIFPEIGPLDGKISY